MRKFLVLPLLMFMAGCPSLNTSAKLMKSYRISLGALQDAEISVYQHGFESQPKHVHLEADIEKLANYGIIADKAILASDKATIQQDIANALTVVEEIEANDVTSIGDQNSRALIGVAVAGLKNLLEQVSISVGGN